MSLVFQMGISMNRTSVIQQIIDKKKAVTYLEIGLANGDNFMPIKAGRKVAVDPYFTIRLYANLIRWLLRNPSSLAARYYQTTSDNYFSRRRSIDLFDVVFIDGLHTFEQSLKDVTHALDVLNEKGVIVLHDCNPPNDTAALPMLSWEHARDLDLPGWTGAWCGDIWKTVCFLRSQRTDLKVFVLDCDFGLGIVTRGIPEGRLNLSEERLEKMTYNDLAGDKVGFLNLKNSDYLSEFLATL
jgi:hypothetical protein